MSRTFTYPSNAGLPELVYASPYCSHCRTDVEYGDDGVLHCNNCLVLWESLDDGAISVFDDDYDEREPCGALSQRDPRESYDYSGKHYEFGPSQPCILPDGHSKNHLHPHEVTTTIIEEKP